MNKGSIIMALAASAACTPASKENRPVAMRLPRNPGARVRVEAFEYSANDGSVRSLTDTVIPYVRPR